LKGFQQSKEETKVLYCPGRGEKKDQRRNGEKRKVAKFIIIKKGRSDRKRKRRKE